jgi:hypothetical protein
MRKVLKWFALFIAGLFLFFLALASAVGVVSVLAHVPVRA